MRPENIYSNQGYISACHYLKKSLVCLAFFLSLQALSLFVVEAEIDFSALTPQQIKLINDFSVLSHASVEAHEKLLEIKGFPRNLSHELSSGYLIQIIPALVEDAESTKNKIIIITKEEVFSNNSRLHLGFDVRKKALLKRKNNFQASRVYIGEKYPWKVGENIVEQILKYFLIHEGDGFWSRKLFGLKNYRLKITFNIASDQGTPITIAKLPGQRDNKDPSDIEDPMTFAEIFQVPISKASVQKLLIKQKSICNSLLSI